MLTFRQVPLHLAVRTIGWYDHLFCQILLLATTSADFATKPWFRLND